MKALHHALPPPEDEKLCVLYDPSTGRIVHTHRVTTMAGGRKVDKAEMEKRTRQRAKSRGRDISGLTLLHVDPETYKLGAFYEVNLRTKKLVETVHKPAAHRLRERQ
jgi:hypothetical protein